MPGPVALFMEGVVLDEDRDSYASSPPIPEGIALAHLLTEAGPVYFVTKSRNTQTAEHWLRVNAGVRPLQVRVRQAQDADLDDQALQRQQIKRLRASSGGRLWLVVTAHPEVGAWCFYTAQCSLTFASPRHASIVPDRKTWMELAKATERSRELMAQDEHDDVQG